MLEIKSNNQLALPPHEASSSNERLELKPYYTGKELYGLDVRELPMLVEGIFLKTGIMVLSGSSDVGKSTFLRQLALSIAQGKDRFLGWKLNSQHNKVIYVSTEDDTIAISYVLNKTIEKEFDNDYLKNVRYVFDSSKLEKNLDSMLQREPADCIIIDSFGDVYDGELNQLNKVRQFLEKYFQLINKYNVLIVFIHHTGKRTEKLPPNKNNMIGSQGIEGRARQVIELRKDPVDSQYRHLCIVKGNYIPEDDKQFSYKMKFKEDLTFEMTEDRVSFEKLVETPDLKRKVNDELTRIIVQLIEVQKLTFEKAAEKITAMGHKTCRSTVNNLYRAYKKNHPSNQNDGPE